MNNEPKLIANLGDASPLEYGGYFVYSDGDRPFVEMVEPPCDDIDFDSEKARWTVYSFDIDKCTFIDGVLSDNKFHPDHAAWFAKLESEKATRPQDTTYLSNVVSQFEGQFTLEEFSLMFCSDDIAKRAWAYREIGQYHGFENLDSDPLTLTKSEVNARYPEHAILEFI